MSNEMNGSAPTADEAADTAPHSPHIHIVKGRPTAAEVAALVVVLGSAGAGPEPARPESTRWGLPVDRLRYAMSNYQRLTMQQIAHMKH